MSDELTPGMIVMLRRIDAGEELDGRSWRSLTAVERRGLVVMDGAKPQLTDAGRKSIAATPAPEPTSSLSLEQWLELRHDPTWKPRKK